VQEILRNCEYKFQLIEINIDDMFEELLMTCVASFLKGDVLLGLLNGSIDTGEDLFNAFDGFK
jgi:hypothetical protein